MPIGHLYDLFGEINLGFLPIFWSGYLLVFVIESMSFLYVLKLIPFWLYHSQIFSPSV